MTKGQTGRWMGSALVALALTGGVTGCVDNPVTGQREVGFVSVERQIAIGEQQYLPRSSRRAGVIACMQS